MENHLDDTLTFSSLDQDGDVTLVVGRDGNCRTFVACSKVLSLASPIFAKMLHSNYKEGQQMRLDKRVTIPLEDDDPEALHTILTALHYKCNEVNLSIEADKLAAVAIVCDKYDCTAAMRPWILQWCGDGSKASTSLEFGYLLLAASMFQSPTIPALAATAVKELAPGFDTEWAATNTLELLPPYIIDAIAITARKAIELLLSDMQAVDEELRARKTVYPVSGLLCDGCGRVHPDNAKKCHHCRNKSLLTQSCSSEVRIADYFSILRRVSLWPIVGTTNDNSLTQLVSRLRCAESKNSHQCGASWDCPLQQKLRLLLVKGQRALESVQSTTMETKLATQRESEAIQE